LKSAELKTTVRRFFSQSKLLTAAVVKPAVYTVLRYCATTLTWELGMTLN